MIKPKYTYDNYEGLTIHGFVLSEKVGEGKIGFVFKAIRNQNEVRACKVIPEDKLKLGWERELEKVRKLSGINNIVQFIDHGTALDKNNRPFVWIFWNFIKGINLKDYIENTPWPLTIATIEDIGFVLLNVLYSCFKVDIQHGDLHSGNILIEDSDPRVFNSKPKFWVSDFGYGGSHNEKQPKDDFQQVTSVILSLLDKLRLSELNKQDRIMHEKLKQFFGRKFAEKNPTQGRHVGNLEVLIGEFNLLKTQAIQESEASSNLYTGKPGDYLSAEAIGNKVDEWKHLFVPEFLASNDLLNRNITVLTGARGCGKTMAFRRLTAYMDKIVGAPSGVIGADKFIGFYLNCRNLIEAFPWIPDPPKNEQLNNRISAQLIHYFHLSWLSEICNTLYVCFHDKEVSFNWLDSFISKFFGASYRSLPEDADHLSHIMSFVEIEKERCRLTEFNKVKDVDWQFYKMDFLDELQVLISKNTAFDSSKPFYFFLDDYTIPIIPREVQKVLNPIIFKRRDLLFFKVSTESIISFERTSIRGKPLELHHDFEFIDLANETLHRDYHDKKLLLEKIFKPRIERDEFFLNLELNLENILGKYNLSWNQLALSIRNERKRVVYHGIECFVGMWSSDIRIMIQMFVDMIRYAQTDLEKGLKSIKPAIQDNVFRTTGGEFVVLAEAVPAPSSLVKSISEKNNETYGSHLIKIVETFVNISKYEMVKGNLVSNQGRKNPKQAFRIEIIDKFQLSTEVKDYYEGLLRWHLFFHDWRGKSMRGMITPRLFLNRVLIPNSQLTFSKHDNIHMTNHEFKMLLKDPGDFMDYWLYKRKEERRKDELKGHDTQGRLEL